MNISPKSSDADDQPGANSAGHSGGGEVAVGQSVGAAVTGGNSGEPGAFVGQPGGLQASAFHPEFQKLIRSRWRFRAYLFMNIPSAFRSGLSIESVDAEKAVISIPFRRFTKNPFHSIYFACLAMAAEMSTGILAMGFIYKQQKVSMLVTSLEARFTKKATGKVAFTCSDGQSIKNTIDNAVISGEPQTITAHAFGTNEAGENIAEFLITWSFKKKN